MALEDPHERAEVASSLAREARVEAVEGRAAAVARLARARPGLMIADAVSPVPATQIPTIWVREPGTAPTPGDLSEPLDWIPRPIFLPGLRLRVRHRLAQASEGQAANAGRSGGVDLPDLATTLAEEWAHAEMRGGAVSWLAIEIDRYAAFRAQYGEAAAARARSELGRAIARSANRPDELVGEIPPERLAVLLPHADALGARQRAEAIRVAVAELAIPHRSAAGAPFVSISVGVATAAAAVGRSVDLVAAAHAALARALAAGGDRAHSRELRAAAPGADR